MLILAALPSSTRALKARVLSGLGTAARSCSSTVLPFCSSPACCRCWSLELHHTDVHLVSRTWISMFGRSCPIESSTAGPLAVMCTMQQTFSSQRCAELEAPICAPSVATSSVNMSETASMRNALGATTIGRSVCLHPLARWNIKGANSDVGTHFVASKTLMLGD